MRRIKAVVLALVLASTLFINAHKTDKAEVPHEPPDEITPISPVYEVPSVLMSLEERRQAQVKAKYEVIKAEKERIARAEEIERRRLAALKKAQPALSRGSNYVGQAQPFTATAYTAYCNGCSGITKTGHDLRKSIYSKGRRVIAVDPRYIPLGSIVRVTLADGSSFEASAQDIGGAIKGAIIDVAHETKQEAYVFGRQSVEIRMIRRGDGK